jgi:hypothetical protein
MIIVIIIGIVLWIAYSLATGMTKREAEIANDMRKKNMSHYQAMCHIDRCRLFGVIGAWGEWRLRRDIRKHCKKP